MPGGVFSTAKLHAMTIRESANDGSDFTSPDADYRRLFLGEDGLLHVKDSAGTVSSPYTSGGVSSGTSNPGAPSANDIFFRTDLGLMIYYDGTRWLTTDLKIATLNVTDNLYPIASGGGTNNGRYPVLDEFSMYLVDFLASVLVGTTNNGSNYHTISLYRYDSANSGTSIVSFNTSADSASTWVRKRVAIDAVLDSTARELQTVRAATGTPGTIFYPTALSFRLVVT